ncbi:MAG: N-(5'-phosphoribosyl)anthranilate isomerase [Ilumatobacter coccineus]|uniref:N-(5'-phosphoribosyl)anthranilate isomerase n=1 Tax=Ilumatobacter coccineus TaxID=467094 RepID=A0A2G6K9K6_9ACTN|nr:MAG: N-(5'-phosphoribosyl)anthranilate isomerase [Ilumatobacter coccineus]
MFIKICGITSEDDALFAVAMGADAVGFVFAPSPHQIAAQKVYDITRRLPPEILTVGVFRNEHPKRVVQIANTSGVKAVQLHGRQRPEDVAEVTSRIRYVIKAFRSTSPDLVHADRYGTDLVMVNAAAPASGQVFDWSLVADVPSGVRMILSGGLTPSNVAEAIDKVEPWGVDVCSGVESQSGKKDPTLVRRFINAAREAAPEPYRGPDEVPYDWYDE